MSLSWLAATCRKVRRVPPESARCWRYRNRSSENEAASYLAIVLGREKICSYMLVVSFLCEDTIMASKSGKENYVAQNLSKCLEKKLFFHLRNIIVAATFGFLCCRQHKNPSGVALAIHQACTQVIHEGGNQQEDPAVRLMTTQLAFLVQGDSNLDLDEYRRLMDACRARAAERRKRTETRLSLRLILRTSAPRREEPGQPVEVRPRVRRGRFPSSRAASRALSRNSIQEGEIHARRPHGSGRVRAPSRSPHPSFRSHRHGAPSLPPMTRSSAAATTLLPVLEAGQAARRHDPAGRHDTRLRRHGRPGRLGLEGRLRGRGGRGRAVHPPPRPGHAPATPAPVRTDPSPC